MKLSSAGVNTPPAVIKFSIITQDDVETDSWCMLLRGNVMLKLFVLDT
ncbi:hypothetical protein [Vibrio vulnificus]|nr:hypothetical protein [Vibrio vulnificus]